jgi:opacity protein-like surface antigen
MKKKTLLATSAMLLVPTLAAAEVNQPQEIIDRPRTTPGGQITVGGDLGLVVIDGNPIGLGLSGLYGVDDKIEVGAAYGFSLKDFEIKGDLGVHAAYSFLDAGALTAAADIGVGYNIFGEALDPLAVGVEAQFKLGDKAAVFTPGKQLSIGLEDPNAINLALPVGIGFQAAPNIYAAVQTQVLNIGISEADSGFIFADYLPLSLGATFSPSNTLDVGASITWGDFLAEDAAGDTVGFKHPTLGLHGRLHI